MKTKNLIITGLLMFLVTGCFVKSLHPFYNEKDVVFKKEFTGNWTGNDSSAWKIEQGSKSDGLFKPAKPDDSYKVTYTDKKGTAVFMVHMFQLRNRYFFDFYPEEVESSNDLMASHLVPMHTVARVDLSSGNLKIQWYNEEWLITLFKQNKIRIAHEKVPMTDGKNDEDNFQVVLTASTEDLQKFMLKYMDDPNAIKNDYTFVLKKKN
jgi:hypothetical protein